MPCAAQRSAIICSASVSLRFFIRPLRFGEFTGDLKRVPGCHKVGMYSDFSPSSPLLPLFDLSERIARWPAEWFPSSPTEF